MAESLRAAGSIVSIVAFGMHLATTMHTNMETMDEADQTLDDVVFDVNTTASALKQLDTIIEKDRSYDACLRVLNEMGIRDVENLASNAAKSTTTYTHYFEELPHGTWFPCRERYLHS